MLNTRKIVRDIYTSASEEFLIKNYQLFRKNGKNGANSLDLRKYY